MADTRPNLVVAVVALEPLGPGMVPLPWGLAATPVDYDPPVLEPGELHLVRTASGTGPVGAYLQPEPARRLTNLADVPIAVVSGEQSFALPGDAATVAFLRQAGCRTAEHLQLGDLGVHGNGHMMMLERNTRRSSTACSTGSPATSIGRTPALPVRSETRSSNRKHPGPTRSRR
jgi:hypothetical protein